MRYFLLTLATLSAIAPFPAIAQIIEPWEIAQKETITPFWTRSRLLMAEQEIIVEFLEATLTNPDPDRIALAREQLYVHLSKVERFLRDYYIVPQLICRDGDTLPPDFSFEQQQVFCALFYARQQLEPLIPVLYRQHNWLTEVELAALQNRFEAIPLNLDGNVNNLFSALIASRETISEPTIVGQPAKPPEANRDLDTRPSIATAARRFSGRDRATIPNLEALYGLFVTKQLLLSAQQFFPAELAVAKLNPENATGEINAFALYPDLATQYRRLLAQPNTGIATIPTAAESPLEFNQLRDRLLPNPEATPIPLETLADGFLPRLALRVEGDNFIIPPRAIRYGFLVEIGDISLEHFPRIEQISTLTSSQRQLFSQYRPPLELAAIQTDQRRFYFGKMGDIQPTEAPPALAYAPIRENSTYILRLVQYQLPSAILNNEPIHRSQRRQTAQILNTPSSDLSIAFRTLRREADGSYVVVWKLLAEHPQPSIDDLIDYVDFQ
ncbi:MAG: hypothetical protein SAJ12_08685 [Jaaginema sp. PMC 1079.18]|nr:hypothetical protein [Jaaginema sp. PMC 1080.18]MEC4851075.1 hypothetical protein [Jaaginema sp. PMC 1079.18]MEC4865038.1 hypothetical protein [Jaaginema sp. PMC 1078.18]